ncbi:unnamed protein product, partial [Ectocarpus fasciculatus]
GKKGPGSIKNRLEAFTSAGTFSSGDSSSSSREGEEAEAGEGTSSAGDAKSGKKAPGSIKNRLEAFKSGSGSSGTARRWWRGRAPAGRGIPGRSRTASEHSRLAAAAAARERRRKRGQELVTDGAVAPAAAAAGAYTTPCRTYHPLPNDGGAVARDAWELISDGDKARTRPALGRSRSAWGPLRLAAAAAATVARRPATTEQRTPLPTGAGVAAKETGAGPRHTSAHSAGQGARRRPPPRTREARTLATGDPPRLEGDRTAGGDQGALSRAASTPCTGPRRRRRKARRRGRPAAVAAGSAEATCTGRWES